MRLYLTALNPTDAVLHGFLPAASSLALPVTVLTDQPERWPSDVSVQGCVVREPAAVLTAVAGGEPPAALLSNSDHLQAATALAARRLGLPGKDPEVARRCKDKAAARRAVAEAGLDPVRIVVVEPGAVPVVAADIFPAVVKPREGVASEDAYLVADHRELAARVAEIRTRRPEVALLVEEYLAGEVRTHETLGDDADLVVLGAGAPAWVRHPPSPRRVSTGHPRRCRRPPSSVSSWTPWASGSAPATPSTSCRTAGSASSR
ncbi:hypothetical protein GCM10027614_19110 [Micromonospora vulcania]